MLEHKESEGQVTGLEGNETAHWFTRVLVNRGGKGKEESRDPSISSLTRISAIPIGRLGTHHRPNQH